MLTAWMRMRRFQLAELLGLHALVVTFRRPVDMHRVEIKWKWMVQLGI